MGCAPSTQSVNHEGKDSPIKAKVINGSPDKSGKKEKTPSKDKKKMKSKSGSKLDEEGKEGGNSKSKKNKSKVDDFQNDKDLLREMENNYLKGERVKMNAKNKAKGGEGTSKTKIKPLDKEAE
jgi:hypothetical protein